MRLKIHIYVDTEFDVHNDFTDSMLLYENDIFLKSLNSLIYPPYTLLVSVLIA